jgi:hypothetical protein
MTPDSLKTPCPGCAERDALNARLSRTAGEYFARWRWVLKLLASMPRPRDDSWDVWLGKRRNALRGWDITGSPPRCRECGRVVQVLFRTPGTVRVCCSTCWLESTGQSPSTTTWRQHVIITADENKPPVEP